MHCLRLRQESLHAVLSLVGVTLQKKVFSMIGRLEGDRGGFEGREAMTHVVTNRTTRYATYVTTRCHVHRDSTQVPDDPTSLRSAALFI